MGSARARGRHTPRMGEGSDRLPDLSELTDTAVHPPTGIRIEPDSPQGRQLGMSTRMQGEPSPIPGGKDHINNAIAFRQRPAAPAPADFTDLPDQNAHGVPTGSHHGFTRAQLVQGKLASRTPPDQYYTRTDAPPRPVPVFIVENQDRGAVFRSAAPQNVQVPPSTANAQEICGRDPHRSHIYLMNEDPANAIRIGQILSDVNNGGGALLPAAMSSYLRLSTQDTLYAISVTTSSPKLSIIQEFDHSGSGTGKA